jgi:hypothetical protein
LLLKADDRKLIRNGEVSARRQARANWVIGEASQTALRMAPLT